MELALLANSIRSPAIHQISPFQRMPSPPAWRTWIEMQGDIPCLLKVTGFAFTLKIWSEEICQKP